MSGGIRNKAARRFALGGGTVASLRSEKIEASGGDICGKRKDQVAMKFVGGWYVLDDL